MTERLALIDANGYLRVGKEYLHRLIVEKVLGRKLNKKEEVHHINGDRADNRNENLVVCPDHSYHMMLHARQTIVEKGGDPNTQAWCDYHCALHNRSEFSTVSGRWNGLHNNCRVATNEYRRLKGLNRDKFDWKAKLNQQYRRAFKSAKAKISPWEECL